MCSKFCVISADVSRFVEWEKSTFRWVSLLLFELLKLKKNCFKWQIFVASYFFLWYDRYRVSTNHVQLKCVLYWNLLLVIFFHFSETYTWTWNIDLFIDWLDGSCRNQNEKRTVEKYNMVCTIWSIVHHLIALFSVIVLSFDIFILYIAPSALSASLSLSTFMNIW